MRVLIDMNLSPRWSTVLIEAGIPAVHWSAIGSATAADSTIMSYAAEGGFVILTNDLDFGIALAMSKQRAPSVVQIRGEDLRPASIGKQVVQALCGMKSELETGALVTIDPKRSRLRFLPLSKD